MPETISRRDYLGRLAMGAGAAGTWAVGTGLTGIWMAAAPQRLAAAPGPNERVGLAIMGVNNRGKQLAAQFAAHPAASIRVICEVDEPQANRVADEVASAAGQRPAVHGDLRKVLDLPEVDALVVATPDHWHASATIMACAAGKHVYVEKPVCHNAAEGPAMIAAARRHNRLVQVGTQRRSSVGVREAIEVLRAGEIGTLRVARGWINSVRPSIGHRDPGPPPAGLDFASWQGPAPERPYLANMVHYHWRWFWDYGTGELGNNGVHAIDVCRWGLGVDAPTRVVSSGGRYHFDDDQQTPDTQFAIWDFGPVAIHWEHRTWHERGLEGQDFGSTFYGEKGTLVVTKSEYRLVNLDGHVERVVALNNGDNEHLTNFLDAIRSGTPLAHELEEGVKSARLCHLGNIAFRTSGAVDFDPQRSELKNPSDTQKALWSREYRPGWEVKAEG